jgi:hypothetical protein
MAMAYPLTKHALCLVIPQSGDGFQEIVAPKRLPKRRQPVSLLSAIDRFGVVAYELSNIAFVI